MRLIFFKYFCVYFVMPVLLALTSISCEATEDALRNWGERGRRSAQPRLNEEEVRRWERDLNLSRARSLELQKSIQDLVQESNRQGMLAWKIGKAYLNAGRYDLASLYYKGAIQGRLPDDLEGQTAPDIATFEQALPFFEEALARHNPDAELLFEAGLCYANASRAAGWERDRFRTAVLLFERMARVAPDDIRSRYQLALLYGKTGDPDLRDVPGAIELLNEVLVREEQDISARFLLGQLYAVQGRLDQAREQYAQIMSILENLHRAGVVPGSPEKNPRYVQARENLETLEACLAGSGNCAPGDSSE